MRPEPSPAEQAMGMRSYLTDTPGTAGRLRSEAEDFQVIEVGPDPPERDGPFSHARVRLRNWETNRFVGKAGKELNVRPGKIGFAGMKDKRAVTEQWFSFPCRPDRVPALERLEDVDVLRVIQSDQKQFPGSHDGNRFILRIREWEQTDSVDETLRQIRAEGGVPNFFGPQRFGSSVRPVTPLMGQAIVNNDLELAVNLYVGTPMAGEPDDVLHARALWDETKEPETVAAAMPARFDYERSILQRLEKRPGEWRYALQALPQNLLRLFIHSYQSLLFNQILSDRLEAGLGLSTAHLGDRVMPLDGDGTYTVPVTAVNQARVQEEMDKGRAFVTAPLLGLDTDLADGEPGRIERGGLEGVDPRGFRCRELPMLASQGRRRPILEPARDLALEHIDGDPVVSFRLGRGAYATVVMREIIKGEPGAY